MERVSHSITLTMIKDLSNKIPKETADCMEAEKKEKHRRIAVIEEAASSFPPSHCQSSWYEMLPALFIDALQVKCSSVEVHIKGKPDSAQPRSVEVVLHSWYQWTTALANA
ncbi:unnamed protein product [Nippostrongylus brasiliensis]|uniref:BTB/POZ domain-containing protein n=1 Tax=Nippostrongylus brasiliensis TaxID=27835 RepID=A0A0N4YR39_NIPBR|nr:unnamed protein product [Nippostrongylus brasiliensis]